MTGQRQRETAPAGTGAARTASDATYIRATSFVAQRRTARKPAPPLFVVWPRDLLALGIAHVESRSRPGHYHTVHSFSRRCDCTGFVCRGRCAHLDAAVADWGRAFREELRAEEQGRRLATLRQQADYPTPMHFYVREQEEAELWAS